MRPKPTASTSGVILIIITVLINTVNGQITRVCSLSDIQVEIINVSNTLTIDRSLRFSRKVSMPLFLPKINETNSFERRLEMNRGIFATEANVTVIDSWQNNLSSPSFLVVEARACYCADNVFTQKKVYCPLDADQCEVWWSNSYDDGHQVSCYKEDWKVVYARYMWYYLVFWFLILTMSLCCTVPGQHAIKFLPSRCFPWINAWISEKILQMEVNEWNRMRDNVAYARHLQRRINGWVSGYKLKTRRYVDIDEVACDNKQCNEELCEKDEKLNYAKKESEKIDSDSFGIDNDELTCAICLIEVQKGDRIADLKCGHLYHSDCLSEWILKKNSCPLCKEPNVAEEIRSFESESDFIPVTSRNNHILETRYGRLRRQVHAKLVSIATGKMYFHQRYTAHASSNRPDVIL